MIGIEPIRGRSSTEAPVAAAATARSAPAAVPPPRGLDAQRTPPLGEMHWLLAEGAAQVLIVDTRAKAARAAMARLNYRFGADRALFARADVADPAQLECAFNAAVDRFGRVDILVNNAAVFDDCHWESAVNTNVKVPSRHECGRHVATFL
ncbi:15-hydroxyprostaglandin dehydrogenase [Gryllus bimaculatus]|nr:15-hydroxyprostaglandin dehydrogenase [Gryllus bimaculatus]